MLEAVKVTYLKDVEYIYEDGEIITVRHTDTGAIIPDETSGYTEQELKDSLWLQEGGQEQQGALNEDVARAMAKLT